MLLLDTCTFIWLTSAPDQLSSRVRTALDEAQDIYLSDVSVWEICLKWQAGKLALPSPPRRWIADQMATWDLSRVGIDQEDLFRASELAELHRDPFDRLLIAQTMVRNAKLLTPDPAIHAYPVAVLW